jgi:hypothetical protein
LAIDTPVDSEVVWVFDVEFFDMVGAAFADDSGLEDHLLWVQIDHGLDAGTL